MHKRLTPALLAVLTLGIIAGCAPSTTLSGQQRRNEINRNFAFDARAINDDIDNLLLLRPSPKLSYYHVR